MNGKWFIVAAAMVGSMTGATAALAAPPPAAHTVTVPHDDSWMPAASTSAAQPAHASDQDAGATQFHFTSDRPHAANTPPPVDPATIGRMPEDSGSDSRMPQSCLANPQQQKCH